MSIPLERIVVIAGPTGSGKTAVALQLAKKIDAEIISADSRQVYRTLNLGTGKPTESELAQVPHHLISAISPESFFSVSQYCDLAEEAFQAIRTRGRVCIVAGGTGLWIRAFLDGLVVSPPPNPEIRQRILQSGPERLHRELAKIDPQAAARISSNDFIRLVRALEIYHTSGQKPSAVWEVKPTAPHPDAVWYGLYLPRKDLYQVIERRIDEWLEQGWETEVGVLLKSGISENSRSLQTLGYRHLIQCIQGTLDREKAVALIKRDTRRYAKRQLTWFRAEKRIQWLDMRLGIDANVEIIVQNLGKQSWLSPQE